MVVRHLPSEVCSHLVRADHGPEHLCKLSPNNGLVLNLSAPISQIVECSFRGRKLTESVDRPDRHLSVCTPIVAGR